MQKLTVGGMPYGLYEEAKRVTLPLRSKLLAGCFWTENV
jgi:hypothetical protein